MKIKVKMRSKLFTHTRDGELLDIKIGGYYTQKAARDGRFDPVHMLKIIAVTKQGYTVVRLCAGDTIQFFSPENPSWIDEYVESTFWQIKQYNKYSGL